MTLAFLEIPIRFASGGLLACLLLATLVGPANAERTPRASMRSWELAFFGVGLTEDYRRFVC